MDKSKISDIHFDGIDHSDYPEFCDAFICRANYDGNPMNQEQLDELNDDRDYVYEKLMEYLY